MFLRHKGLIPAFALVMVVAAAIAAQADVTVGEKAPSFKLSSVTGASPVALSDFIDKPTVLAFWVSWCPHCLRELPILQKLSTDYKGKASVVGVSVDDNKSDAKGALDGITFPNAFAGDDGGEKVIRDYGIRGVPAIFIIDKGGIVRAQYAGETESSVIRGQLAKLGAK